MHGVWGKGEECPRAKLRHQAGWWKHRSIEGGAGLGDRKGVMDVFCLRIQEDLQVLSVFVILAGTQ